MTADPAKHARAIRAIADAVKIEPMEVPTFLARLWEGWENHPVYPGWYEPDEAGFTPHMDIYNPVAAAVFKHELGRSYIVGNLQDLIANIEWGKHNLGDFSGIEPIPPDLPVSRWYVLVVGQSPRGRGNAYLCRQALKRLLPSRLHRWISLARRVNSRPKWHLLPPASPDAPSQWWKNKEFLPDWYRTMTKAEIFIYRLLPEKARQEISAYIDLEDFWKAATGRVPAEEVPSLFRARQLRLDI